MPQNDQKKRTLFRHPLSAIAGALVAAGGALFVILVLIDVSASTENPYRSLVTFVLAPAIIALGALLFMISVWLQVKRARAKGERVRFTLSIDPADPKYIRNLWVFLGSTAVLVLIVVYAGTEAYDATESVAFCGETCHEVMEPQYVTYHNSPHARVPCAECHIGPGASFWVKSKVDGIRQVYASAFDTYSRPIETPIENLRPARETCEHCHWPQQFYGDKLLTKTYYRTDEENSPWTISMRVKIGGGNPGPTGRVEGIHYHMLTENQLQYVANDRKLQEISWVRSVSKEGDTTIYTNEEYDQPDLSDPSIEIRTFDCMDCHNRPSHKFKAPANAINEALHTGQISTALPYIRQKGVDLLNAEYEDRFEAEEGIDRGLREYYEDDYPDLVDSLETEINQAVDVLQGIYRRNFFPEMDTDYRVRENNLTHFVNDGCFRCHNQYMATEDGETVATSCETCHVIVAQGPSENVDNLEMNLTGLEFQHPEDIDEYWKEVNCTACHTPDQGY
jgi:hypothetical protein